MARNKRYFVKLITRIIIILMVLAIFSPFISYIFTSDTPAETPVDSANSAASVGF